MGKKRRQLKKQRKNERKRKLKLYSAQLNSNLPKSEIWFHELFKQYQIFTDKRNQAFAGYIPDIINKEFKYIIEIDGSIHLEPQIIKKDKMKTKKYQSLGYEVIRIQAHDMDSFKCGVERILKCREKYFPAKIYSEREIKQLIS